MALQPHKDFKDISNTNNPESTQSGNNGPNVLQEVGLNNGQRMQPYGNEQKNWQALLQLSSSLHTSDGMTCCNTATPRSAEDDERELFLREAMKSLSTDVVGHIKTLIETITKTASEEERQFALIEMSEHVCCIDNAKCFYQLGGLDVIVPLLKYNKSEVRVLALRIIQECCQNNPFCQELTVGDDIFSSIMENTESKDHIIIFHAFSAISAIVRCNPKGLEKFKEYNGFDALKKGLEICNTRITNKISFFISYLSGIEGPNKDDLVNAKIVPALIGAVMSANNIFAAEALLSVISNHPQAIRELCKNNYFITEYILKTVDEKHSKADPEFLMCCSKIADIVENNASRSRS